MPHYSKLTSETLIDLSIELNTSSQLRELIQDNMSFVEERQLSQSEMSFQLTESLKVLPFAILNHLLEIRVHIQDAQEHTPLLSDILKMDQEQELDYLQDQEKLFQEIVELPLELLLVEEEMKSLL